MQLQPYFWTWNGYINVATAECSIQQFSVLKRVYQGFSFHEFDFLSICLFLTTIKSLSCWRINKRGDCWMFKPTVLSIEKGLSRVFIPRICLFLATMKRLLMLIRYVYTINDCHDQVDKYLSNISIETLIIIVFLLINLPKINNNQIPIWIRNWRCPRKAARILSAGKYS